jgi:hypothetical protein
MSDRFWNKVSLNPFKNSALLKICAAFIGFEWMPGNEQRRIASAFENLQVQPLPYKNYTLE